MGAAKFLGVASQPPIVSRVATAGGGVESGLATRSKRSLDDLEVSSVAFSDDSVYRSSGRNARDPSGHAAPLYRPPALHVQSPQERSRAARAISSPLRIVHVGG